MVNDQSLMENALQLTKGSGDLYLHGTLESSSADVHAVFQNALDETTKMEHEIYNFMTEKGWYQVQQVEEQKVQQTKQKFSQNSAS